MSTFNCIKHFGGMVGKFPLSSSLINSILSEENTSVFHNRKVQKSFLLNNNGINNILHAKLCVELSCIFRMIVSMKKEVKGSLFSVGSQTKVFVDMQIHE